MIAVKTSARAIFFLGQEESLLTCSVNIRPHFKNMVMDLGLGCL